MKLKKFNKNIVFIIGTGRSGTHLIGRTLASSSHVDAYIEAEEFFKPITEIAVGINSKKEDYNSILRSYKKRFQKSKKNYILEKTHPNIWFVEKIIDYFPTAKFIGIKRNVFSTVSSMLNHKGVLSWYDKLPLDQVNPFLGINEENKKVFKELPLECKCALRWKSHMDRMEYLEKKFPEYVHVIDYEDFYKDNNAIIAGLKTFLGIEFDLKIEPINNSSNEKWKSNLSSVQISNIEKILTNEIIP